MFSEKGVEMSLCVGNGLCALLELYLNFLSFTTGQEMAFVTFVALICPMGLSCTGGRIPWAVGEWALQARLQGGINPRTSVWRLCALTVW